MADVDGLDHTWRPVNLLCDVQLLTLALAPEIEDVVFAVGLGEGLFTIKLDDVQPNIEPSLEFNAVGHLVVDPDSGLAYASAANEEVSPNAYDRVYEIDLAAANILAAYSLQRGDELHTGKDDIAIVPAGPADDLAKLYVVADVSKETSKLLFAFQVQTQNPPTILDLPDTTIRLGHVWGSEFLMVSAEDHYSVYLVWTAQDVLVKGYQLPVQIAPIALAVAGQVNQVYVLNALSPTLTQVAGEHMQPVEKPGAGELHPGSQEFLEEMIRYRRAIFAAYLDLLGGLLQYLKDCFCHHLLVDCPECSPDDEVYLASVTIRGREVYQVCNFSRRKYVKSFPTVGYWLSLIPLSPFIHKAVEYLCCLVLPELFGRLGAPGLLAYDAPVQSHQMRSGAVPLPAGLLPGTAPRDAGQD